MRCDWRNDPTAPIPCRVIDDDTQEVLSPCVMADEEAGLCIRYKLRDGLFFVENDEVATEEYRGNIRIEYLG